MRTNKCLAVFLLMALTGFTSVTTGSLLQSESILGAWHLMSTGQNSVTAVKIIADQFFMEAHYDLEGKRFISARGGTYTLKNGIYKETIEFDTADSVKVGSTATFSLKAGQGKINITDKQTKKEQIWERVEEPVSEKSALAGAWRIREREQNGQLVTMQQGPRKTIKILSGSRFQWAAFNTATKQFSGTGGGSYTAKDGKYTETIAFFSRDGSRVGANLSFKYEVKGNDWHHSGLSSTGNKIYEIWAKQ